METGKEKYFQRGPSSTKDVLMPIPMETYSICDCLGPLSPHPLIRQLSCKPNEPVHEIFNNVVCATSKASDQPAHTRRLIRAFANRLSIVSVLSY